ncbi:hypothetical protein BKA62DRAFT_774124 [Auriculariales sp. MPI-PUGE-AT-0066]|nr:hypothetical protein BKA62DRAFT_774124 [Auriculariales sp. MPI-PUGE-AT-0066]
MTAFWSRSMDGDLLLPRQDPGWFRQQTNLTTTSWSPRAQVHTMPEDADSKMTLSACWSDSNGELLYTVEPNTPRTLPAFSGHNATEIRPEYLYVSGVVYNRGLANTSQSVNFQDPFEFTFGGRRFSNNEWTTPNASLCARFSYSAILSPASGYQDSGTPIQVNGGPFGITVPGSGAITFAISNAWAVADSPGDGPSSSTTEASTTPGSTGTTPTPGTNTGSETSSGSNSATLSSSNTNGLGGSLPAGSSGSGATVPSPGPSSAITNAPEPKSNTVPIAVGVCVGVVLLIVAIVALLFFRRRRQRWEEVSVIEPNEKLPPAFAGPPSFGPRPVGPEPVPFSVYPTATASVTSSSSPSALADSKRRILSAEKEQSSVAASSPPNSVVGASGSQAGSSAAGSGQQDGAMQELYSAMQTAGFTVNTLFDRLRRQEHEQEQAPSATMMGEQLPRYDDPRGH